MDRFEDHKRHSSVRRALVGAVLEGMRKAQYEPPAETVDLFNRWVSDDVSVSVYEMDAVLRPFMKWKEKHPTERRSTVSWVCRKRRLKQSGNQRSTPTSRTTSTTARTTEISSQEAPLVSSRDDGSDFQRIGDDQAEGRVIGSDDRQRDRSPCRRPANSSGGGAPHRPSGPEACGDLGYRPSDHLAVDGRAKILRIASS